MEDPAPLPLLTVGHSTRPLLEFVKLLNCFGVRQLVDVRTVPRSRQNPQFNRETLPSSLLPSGIAYNHASDLGGFRRPRPDSTNSGWRNASFRGFADYMATSDFDRALGLLIARSRAATTVIMCAEAVPWRCHRSLIADAVVARGLPVSHIMGIEHTTPHRLTPWAVVQRGRPTYPASATATDPALSPV